MTQSSSFLFPQDPVDPGLWVPPENKHLASVHHHWDILRRSVSCDVRDDRSIPYPPRSRSGSALRWDLEIFFPLYILCLLWQSELFSKKTSVFLTGLPLAPAAIKSSSGNPWVAVLYTWGLAQVSKVSAAFSQSFIFRITTKNLNLKFWCVCVSVCGVCRPA